MIVQERSVFYHEQASGSYRPTTYAVSLSFIHAFIHSYYFNDNNKVCNNSCHSAPGSSDVYCVHDTCLLDPQLRPPSPLASLPLLSFTPISH